MVTQTQDGVSYMTEKSNRWSQLMSNLEAVVYSAIVMKDYKEMTEEQYQHFNNTIAQLEDRARDLR